MHRSCLFSWVAAAGLLCGGVPARAEVSLDLYLGQALTSDAEVSAERRDVFPAQRGSRQADFDPSGVFGGRVGFWSKGRRWLGAALDLSSYRARSEIIDLEIVPVSALLLLRWPVAPDPASPGGRVQPYLGLGPSLVYSRLSVDLGPEVEEKITETYVDLGWDARAGLSWQFHRHFALFGEYRYLHFRVDYEERSITWLLGMPSTTLVSVDTAIDTQQLLAGLSCRF